MVEIPPPSGREVRWAFYVVAACGLALTLTICWGIVHKVNQSDDIVHVAASAADQVEHLTAQLEEQARAGEQQRRTLVQQNRQQRRQLDALIDYLRAHGLKVPQVALTPSGGGGTGPKERPGTKPTKPPRPESPGITGTPTPRVPSTSPGGDGLLCGLVPLLCPLL